MHKHVMYTCNCTFHILPADSQIPEVSKTHRVPTKRVSVALSTYLKTLVCPRHRTMNEKLVFHRPIVYAAYDRRADPGADSPLGEVDAVVDWLG